MRAFIEQSGSVTPGHITKWRTDGVIQDGGAIPVELPIVSVDTGMIFSTRSDVIAATIPNTVLWVQTQGYAAVDDGGGGYYIRSTAGSPTAILFQSADGAWWLLASNPYTLGQFGAVGDGGTDDTTAVQLAFTTAATNEIKLLGASNATYLISSSVSKSGLNGVNFDGNGCTFILTGSVATYFDFTNSTVIAFTSLASDAILGSNTITVTSATGFAIGDVLIIEILRASVSGFNGFATIITDIAGTTITLQDRIPQGIATVISGPDAHAVFTHHIERRGEFKNATFDGDAGTNATMVALSVSSVGGKVSGLRFLNCHGSNPFSSTAFFPDKNVGSSFSNIYTYNCGNDAGTRYCSSCTFSDYRCFQAQAFGPQWFAGSLNTVSDITVHGSGTVTNSRGLLLQGECSSVFNNLTIINPRFTGLSLTRFAQSNVISNVLSITEGIAANNTEAVWTSDNSNINNVFNNVVAVGSAAADGVVVIFPSDTGNVFGNLYVYPSGVSNISDGATGGTYFDTVNGFPYQPFVTLVLSTGANNNVAIQNNTENFRIFGPGGAFNISGFVAGRNGQKIVILKPLAFNMTINNMSGSSSVGNKIYTFTGSDVTLTGGNSMATFVYSASDAVWYLTGTRG